MQRRQVVVFLVACALLGIVTYAFWPGEPEPRYNGKSVSQWLDIAANGNPMFVRETAFDALQRTGTNGIPILVRWVGYETPKWKLSLARSSTNLPSFLSRGRFYTWLADYKKVSRADAAARALERMGCDALPAVKELSRIEANHSNPTASRRAWIVMAVIGRRLAEAEQKQSLPAPAISTNQAQRVHRGLSKGNWSDAGDVQSR